MDSEFNAILNPKHQIKWLADAIDWSFFEKAFEPLYAQTGRPAHPIGVMVGCLMLKRLYNLGDETLMDRWIENPTMQYFTGSDVMKHQPPCDPSDWSHFRDRIGQAGVEKIFAYSVQLHQKEIKKSSMVLSDTTVQGNHGTFPTDAKLNQKVIDQCHKIAKKEKIPQRQTDAKASKELLRQTFNGKHPRRAQKAKKATSKLKTLAGRQVRELGRKRDPQQKSQYQKELTWYQKVIHQQRFDKNKVVAIHKPFTACIAKGKAHRMYEFGNKVGLIATGGPTMIITAIRAFEGNPHDSKTIQPLLEQHESIVGLAPQELVYDRGGRGKRQMGNTKISIPGKPLKSDTPYQKHKKRKKFRRRAAIEPLIGHLKTEHRMQENYLMGAQSPTINASLAATGWNLKKFMEQLVQDFLFYFFRGTSLSVQRTLIIKIIELEPLKKTF